MSAFVQQNFMAIYISVGILFFLIRLEQKGGIHRLKEEVEESMGRAGYGRWMPDEIFMVVSVVGVGFISLIWPALLCRRVGVLCGLIKDEDGK